MLATIGVALYNRPIMTKSICGEKAHAVHNASEQQEPACLLFYYNVSSLLGQHRANVAMHHCIAHPVCLYLNRTRCRRSCEPFCRRYSGSKQEERREEGKKTGIVPGAWLICHPGLATVWSLWYLSRAQNTIGNSLGHPAHHYLMLIPL